MRPIALHGQAASGSVLTASMIRNPGGSATSPPTLSKTRHSADAIPGLFAGPAPVLR